MKLCYFFSGFAETRGRIFAVLLMLGNIVAILPLVILGNLTDWLGVNVMLALLAALMGTLAVAALREHWIAARTEGMPALRCMALVPAVSAPKRSAAMRTPIGCSRPR
ncbi:MAG: hypothetical protein C4321_10025, partial [Chloroflexota bacterium]